MTTRADINDAVEATAWLDTHEHLLEESTRLARPSAENRFHPCDDWSYLFLHYAADDLAAAGMTPEERALFFGDKLGPAEKWAIFARYWPLTRNTGYMRAAVESTRRLFGLEPAARTVDAISEAMAELRRPGFYRSVLNDFAGVEQCQVNSLEATFCQTQYPDLMPQDLNIGSLCLPDREHLDDWQSTTSISIATLDDMVAVIDFYFERFARSAVAVKLAWAYERPLAVGPADVAGARRGWQRWISGEEASAAELAPLQDYLLLHALHRTQEAGLPIKIHTGYFVGNDRMPLARVRDNLPDLVPLVTEFPQLKFVLMHIAYPYQGELIAMAKHFRNVFADLCWAWIIDPVSSQDFLRRALAAVPASKLLCFGGDYMVVENVVGHAAIARSGLAGALVQAVDDSTIDMDAAVSLVPVLMNGNARRVFGTPSDSPSSDAS